MKTASEKPTAGQVLLELFQQSVIVQSLITLIVLGVLGYRVAAYGSLDAVPEIWTHLTTLIVGYWFGAKGNFQAIKQNRDTLQALKDTTRAFADSMSRKV
jgi:hypothetical protein